LSKTLTRSVIGGLAAVLPLLGGALSCGKADPVAPAQPSLRQPSRWANSPAVCGQDEVREFFCDELLPLSAALPAPEPFANCPSIIEHHHGEHRPMPPVAVFDKSYTSYIRKRHPPGHNCCYSWCAPVEVRTLDQVLPQAGCGEPLVVRETYCLPTLEAGTSVPASAELPRCPVAIVPPAGKAFSVPPAAPLDLATTGLRRSQGFDECCYGWCSLQPGGAY
jgi:hypothetical protein